jgi:hypothetical protein
MSGILTSLLLTIQFHNSFISQSLGTTGIIKILLTEHVRAPLKVPTPKNYHCLTSAEAPWKPHSQVLSLFKVSSMRKVPSPRKFVRDNQW